MRAGWAGRWGPSTTAVAQSGGSGQEACMCDVCLCHIQSSRQQGQGLGSYYSHLCYKQAHFPFCSTNFQ